MKKKIKLGELNKIYEKYGDLNIEVETPYGFKKIEKCGIVEKNADIYRCELKNGLYVEGADHHKLKKADGGFISLKNIKNEKIQTRYGNIEPEKIFKLGVKDDLYDIQVADVHQYYSNDIVSHNSSFAVDAPYFLYFGKTTKTDKNEEIFNQYSDGTDLEVKGMLEIDGQEYIIERTMKRKMKKNGNWDITNKVVYYEILSNGEERRLEGENATKTSDIIKDYIGTEDDFMLSIVATARNLEDLIESTPTEKAKLINRFIGLDVIEEKEKIARKKYNEYAKTMKSNHYNLLDLEEGIDEYKEKINNLNIELENKEGFLNTKKKVILKLEDDKDKLYGKKIPIDKELLDLKPNTIKEKINEITVKGKYKAKEIEKIKFNIKEIGDITFDEDLHHELTLKLKEIDKKINKYEINIDGFKEIILTLKNSEMCPKCGKKLDGVNNLKEIEGFKNKIEELEGKLKEFNKTKVDLETQLESLNKTYQLINKRDKLELKRDQLDVDIVSLRNKLKSFKNDLKSYQLNIESIEYNKKIESDILAIKTKINMENIQKDKLYNEIQEIKSDIADLKDDIDHNEKLILIIKEEQIKEKNYKVYIQMVGKKGVTQIVLTSVLPIINSELHRLLDEVVDFEVEVDINSKNEVEFYLIKDNVYKKLKSGSGLERTVASLGLRFVLSQISSLPKPNFIVFDEIFGKIANENLEYVKLLFDKASDMFDTIFIITHLDMVKDWVNNIITSIKSNNISKISIE